MGQGSPDQDRVLLDRCIAGDPQGWRDFMRQYGALIHHAVFTTFRRVLRLFDQNQIEEAVQSVWVALLEDGCRRLRKFEMKAALSTYLTIVATRRTLDFLRQEKRKGSMRHLKLDDEDRELLEELPARPPEKLGDQELESLYEAMHQLPEPDKLILKMAYVDGLSGARIAAILGVAKNSVSSALHRAREKLKQVLAGPRGGS